MAPGRKEAGMKKIVSMSFGRWGQKKGPPPTFGQVMRQVLVENVKARTVVCPNPICGKPIDVTFDEEERLANGKNVRCQICKVGTVWVPTSITQLPKHQPKAVYVRL